MLRASGTPAGMAHALCTACQSAVPHRDCGGTTVSEWSDAIDPDCPSRPFYLTVDWLCVVKPPQLDEFFLAEEAPLRAEELAVLGLREADIWPGALSARAADGTEA